MSAAAKHAVFQCAPLAGVAHVPTVLPVNSGISVECLVFIQGTPYFFNDG